MEKRYVLFLTLSTAIMLAWLMVTPLIFGPAEKPGAKDGRAAVAQRENAEQRKSDRDAEKPPSKAEDRAPAPGAEPAAATDTQKVSGEKGEQEGAAAAPQVAEQAAAAPVQANGPAVKAAAKPPEEPPLEELQLGSLDAADNFKIRVTLTNRGASVRGIELSEYLDEHRAGPLKVIDPQISPGTDSFRLEVLETADGKKKDQGAAVGNLAGRNWRAKVTDTATTTQGRKVPVEVTFETAVPELDGLVVAKRYRLEPKTYELRLAVEYRLPAQAKAKEFTYRLETANGLPLEGEWYAISFREAVVGSPNGNGSTRNYWVAHKIADAPEGKGEVWENKLIRYAGVDCQYFAVVTVPHHSEKDRWIASGRPLLVEANAAHKERSDITYELTSTALTLEPGASLQHQYTIFAGPKDPRVLTEVARKEVPQAGLISLMNWEWRIAPLAWLGYVSPVMVAILKFFHGILGNWGLAILLLTVGVRAIMFPLSLKQVLSAQKMQQLQPQIAELREKYKNDKAKLGQAQMELMRKHGANPLSGCLPMFVQLPIFVGLYWALRLAIDLRQAPLIAGLGWCGDLSAPDMLFAFPGFVVVLLQILQQFPLIGALFNLGPYFNLLPIITIAIFLVQQKMFMPPPADEQAAMQQKMMTWMMVLMGLLFYKVPSGLCLYFIASSGWSIGERMLLPKMQRETPRPAPPRPKKKGKPLSGTRRR